MIEIEICEQSMDYWTDFRGNKWPKYHAQIKGDGGYWGQGKNPNEAIGDLVQNHLEMFNLKKITNLGKQAR